MKTFYKFLVVSSICSCTLTMQQSLAGKSTIDQLSTKTVPLQTKIVVGSSISSPIVIKGIKTYDKVQEKQEDYILKRYEGYSILIDQFSFEENGHFIQSFILTNDEGEYAEIYFDISDICKSSRKLKDKNLERRIQKAKNFAKYEVNG